MGPADNILIYVADQGLHWDTTADQSERREGGQSVSQSVSQANLFYHSALSCLLAAFMLPSCSHKHNTNITKQTNN